jgi:hypothetical protein
MHAEGPDSGEFIPGYQLLFPGAPGYARRYLATASGDGAGAVFSWERDGDLDRVVERAATAVVATADREAGLSQLPEQARSALLARERLFLSAMRTLFPPLLGEAIEDEHVSVLAEPCGAAPAGSLVYRRRTGEGTMIVVDETRTVDVRDGTVRYSASRPRPVAAPANLAAGAAVPTAEAGGIDTVESALDIFKGLLGAFGPEGAVISAGISLLELIFGIGSGVDLPKVINDLVVQDFANDHVKTDLTNMMSYSDWLSEAMSGTVSNKDADFDALKQAWNGYVVNACDPGYPLLQAISNLENGTYTSDPPYSVLGLPAFLFGTALHLTFERTKLLFSTDGKTFRSPQMSYIVNVAKDYLSHIDSTIAIIDAAFADRLNGISQPTYAVVTNGTAWRGGISYSQAGCVYVTDPAASTWPQQTLIPTADFSGHTYGYPNDTVWMEWMPTGCNASTDPTPLLKDGETWRANYVASLTSQLAVKYNATADRRADLATARDQLKTVIDKYSTAIPPSPTEDAS